MFLKGLFKFEKDKKLLARINLLLLSWQEAYPNVDLKKEAQFAHAWLLSNKKSYTDMAKFLNNWFKSAEQRTTDRRQMTRRQEPKYVETRPPEEEVMSAEDWAQMKARLPR